MIRTLDENLNIQNIPWALTTIPGGSMDNKKLVSQILTVISKLKKFKNDDVDAASAFLKQYRETFPDTIPPVIPSFVACCSLVEVDLVAKNLHLKFDNWPVALIGDGCSVNKLAGKKLGEQIGLVSPNTRCTSHAATGSIRRLSTSKTMCVDEVVTFAAHKTLCYQHFCIKIFSIDISLISGAQYYASQFLW